MMKCHFKGRHALGIGNILLVQAKPKSRFETQQVQDGFDSQDISHKLGSPLVAFTSTQIYDGGFLACILGL